MTKNLSYLFLVGILAACDGRTKNTTEISQDSTQNQTPIAIQVAEVDSLIGAKGAEIAKFRKEGENNYFTYADAQVIEETGENGSKTTIKTPSFEFVIDRNPDNLRFFHGKYQNFIFIDEGTLDFGRTLRVFDLKTGKELYKIGYDRSDLAILEGTLSFLAFVEEKKVPKKPDCPQAKEWKAGGLGIGYMEQRKLDLGSGKITNTGIFICAPVS